MLFATEAVIKKRAEIAREYQDGKITELEAGQRTTEADPDFGGGYALMGRALAEAGDPAGAEAYYWKALERRPFDYAAYLALAEVRRMKGDEDALSERLMELGVWKLAYSSEVAEDVAGYFRDWMGDRVTDVDFKKPTTYGALALTLEQRSGEAGAEVRERLLPYELLNELQDQAGAGMDEDLLRETLANAGRCIPVWRSALRETFEGRAGLPSDALGQTIALFGETAGAEALDDLLELIDLDERRIFLHANWAVWRLGQRFPAEALAKLRAVGAGAPAALRCLLLEQMELLPETPGIAEAMVQLLDGFAGISGEPEAAYLLAAVVDGLEYRGDPQRAEETYKGMRGRLSKAADRQVLEMLEQGVAPLLKEEEIDAVTIEDICRGRMWMDDQNEDEGGEEEEEYEERVEPVIAKPKPGRNEPCWCGSGKKYKKCHLTADEDAERSGGGPAGEPEEEPPHAKLQRELLLHTRDWHRASDFERGAVLYFGRPMEEVESEDPDILGGFFEWYIHDYRPASSGRTLIEEYLRRRSWRVTEAERELLRSWTEARFGVWEVQRIEEGRGVEVEDVFDGSRMFVRDVSCSRAMVRWDCVLARVHESEGVWYFAGNGLGVPRTLMGRFVERIERESRAAGQSVTEFVRANSHRWHRVVHEMAEEQFAGLRLVNFEGDPIEFSVAVYKVEDRGAAVKALEGAEAFADRQDTPDACSFAWLEADTGGARRSYGNIEIREGKLRLECNSKKRLAAGRELVEKHAGRWLKHLGDSFESMEAFKRKATDRRGAKQARPPSGIPPEVEREILGKLKAEHYSGWVDQRLPALDGQTPKEAARSKAGRRALEDLLRTMENGEERIRREGGAGFDFSGIRKSLGM